MVDVETPCIFPEYVRPVKFYMYRVTRIIVDDFQSKIDALLSSQSYKFAIAV